MGHPWNEAATREMAKEKLRHQETSPLGNLRAARAWGAGLRSEVWGRSPDSSAEGLGRRRQPWVFLDWAVDAFRVRDVFGGLLCHLSKTAARCLSQSSRLPSGLMLVAGLWGALVQTPPLFVKVKGGAGVQRLSDPGSGISKGAPGRESEHYSEGVGMFFRNVPTSPLLSGPRNTHRTDPAGARLQQPEALE